MRWTRGAWRRPWHAAGAQDVLVSSPLQPQIGDACSASGTLPNRLKVRTRAADQEGVECPLAGPGRQISRVVLPPSVCCGKGPCRGTRGMPSPMRASRPPPSALQLPVRMTALDSHLSFQPLPAGFTEPEPVTACLDPSEGGSDRQTGRGRAARHVGSMLRAQGQGLTPGPRSSTQLPGVLRAPAWEISPRS